jgi:hypothetical protein
MNIGGVPNWVIGMVLWWEIIEVLTGLNVTKVGDLVFIINNKILKNGIKKFEQI